MAESILSQSVQSEKLCSKCGASKPLGEFYRNAAMPLGVTSACRDCTYKPKGDRHGNAKYTGAETERECSACKQKKPLSGFHRAAGRALGVYPQCKDCSNVRGKISAGRFDLVVSRRGRGRVKFREWRHKKLSEGLCTQCGRNPLSGGRVRCAECIEKRKGARPRKLSKVAAKRKARRKTKNLKHRLLERFGVACICCGEENEAFLTVDHVNNDGNLERKGRGRIDRRTYLKGERTDLQTLCFNCNCGKQAKRGTCPHKILAEGESWNMVSV